MNFVKEGGVAGFLNRKLFGKKDEEEKGINTYSDGDGEVKEKKENKLMDFVKGGGVAGFLGRKLFGKKEEEEDTGDKKTKLEYLRYGTPDKYITVTKGLRLDALSKEEAIEEFKKLSDKIAKASADVRKGKKNIDKPTKKEEIKFRSLGILLEHKFKVNTHSLKANVNVEYKDLSDNMNLIEVDPNFDFDENPYESKKSIQPIIESENKNAIENLSQSVAAANQNIQILSTQNQIENRPNNQPQTTVPSSPPQVSPAELKNTMAPIPAINILKMGSEKYLSISGNSVMVAS